MSKFKVESFVVADTYDLEAKIKKEFGADVEIAAEREMGNDSYFIYDPRRRTWGENDKFASGWQADLDENNILSAAHSVKTGGWGGRVDFYLAQLYEKGILPDDLRLLVSVSW